MSDIINPKFITDLAFKKIDFNSDSHRCVLCSEYLDITEYPETYDDVKDYELEEGFGYETSGVEVSTSVYYDVEDNVTVYDCEDIVWNAVDGDIGPVRYAILYNETVDNSIVYIFDFEKNKTAVNGAKFEIKIHPNGLMRAKQKT